MELLREFTCKCNFIGGGESLESSPTLNSVRSTARSLAKDVCSVEFLVSLTADRSDDVVAETMKRLVVDLSRRHQIAFGKMVQDLTAVQTSENVRLKDSLAKVLSDMFKDGQVNWGRLVALYAFGHCLAGYCVDRDTPEMVDQIVEVTASYIEDNLSEWILNQGGWESFAQHFREEERTESKVWKGLLCTFLGLGTLATITALK